MKTAILSIAMILMISVANARPASDSPTSPRASEQTFSAWVISPEANLIKFLVKNPLEDKVVMKIYDENNTKVFQRKTRKVKKLGLSVDMTNLGNGTYTCVILKNGNEEVRKVITLN